MKLTDKRALLAATSNLVAASACARFKSAPAGRVALLAPPPHDAVSLLQRVHRNFAQCQRSGDVVLGCGIGTSPLRKGGIFHAPAMQQPRQTIVAFEAARLGIEPVLFIALLRELLRSEEHTSELQSRGHLVCRLL